MIKSELSKKAIELAELDGWYRGYFGDWQVGRNNGNMFIDYSATTKELILMYRSEAKKEMQKDSFETLKETLLSPNDKELKNENI